MRYICYVWWPSASELLLEQIFGCMLVVTSEGHFQSLIDLCFVSYVIIIA